MIFLRGRASGPEGTLSPNDLSMVLHPRRSSTPLHSIYFSPSLVYLAVTLEVCILSDHAPPPI
jgi:hypothetical protein